LSWLRASRKVVDPDGVAWDIYVTRARFGEWKALDIGAGDDFAGDRVGLLWLLMVPVLVVVELAAGLRRGSIAQPEEAVFLGELE
jgi:hypothetical protein